MLLDIMIHYINVVYPITTKIFNKNHQILTAHNFNKVSIDKLFIKGCMRNLRSSFSLKSWYVVKGSSYRKSVFLKSNHS